MLVLKNYLLFFWTSTLTEYFVLLFTDSDKLLYMYLQILSCFTWLRYVRDQRY